MAVNSTTFSGKQFEVYIGAEDTIGTFDATSNWSGNYQIDVEGITLPTFNPAQEFEMRTGSGRIAEFAQVFSSTKRVVTEFTLTGRLNLMTWTIFMENIMADTFDGGTGSDSVMTTPNDYAPANFKHGDSHAENTDFEETLSVYFQAPTAADSYKLSGCVCTSFSIDADMDSNAGRFNYSATFQTGYQPAKGAQSVSSAASIGSDYMYLSTLGYKNIDIKDYDGSTDQDGIDPIFKTFNMSIESPSQFLGAQGANANPQVFARAVPELDIKWGGAVKYDAETDNLLEAHRDTGSASYLTFYMSDVDKAGGTYAAPTGNRFGASSSQKFGIWFGKSKLTSCEVTSDDVAMVNFEAKVLAPASGDTAYFLAQDNA